MPPLHRKPLVFIAIILLAFSGVLHPAVTFKLYDIYAHQRVNIKSLPKPWKKFPFNDRFYRVTSRSAGVVTATREGGFATDPSVCGKSILHQHTQQIYEPIVPCNEFEGFQVDICALDQATRNASQDGCTDRAARWGPYIDSSWEQADLGAMQKSCAHLNEHRFQPGFKGDYPALGPGKQRALRPVPRTAVVLRSWTGFNWTEDDLHNIRAMVAELTLSTGGEYEVFNLMQIRDDFEGDVGGDFGVPASLRGLTETWRTADCQQAYPDVGEYEVYFHSFMALQLFAQRHSEFDFFWNWEMDARSLGHYGRTLSDLSRWAKEQPRDLMWTRNARFYIPSYHGTYQEFAEAIERDGFEDPEDAFESSPPRSPSPYVDPDEADLVTLSPMFDTKNTLWPWRNHLINLSPAQIARPLRVSIITNVRISRSLLAAMHAQNVDGQAMPCEMVPSTVALHRGYKAVFVPHPVYHDRVWPADMTQTKYNAGPGGQVGGSLDTVMNQEHYFRGVSYFWNARFGLELYRRWLGLAEEGPGSSEVRLSLRWEEENAKGWMLTVNACSGRPSMGGMTASPECRTVPDGMACCSASASRLPLPLQAPSADPGSTMMTRWAEGPGQLGGQSRGYAGGDPATARDASSIGLRRTTAVLAGMVTSGTGEATRIGDMGDRTCEDDVRRRITRLGGRRARISPDCTPRRETLYVHIQCPPVSTQRTLHRCRLPQHPSAIVPRRFRGCHWRMGSVTSRERCGEAGRGRIQAASARLPDLPVPYL
nr:hypothetical protein CFP56_29847 [Quercus suber]